MSDTPGHLPRGQRLGPYEIIEVLGAGGMGVKTGLLPKSNMPDIKELPPKGRKALEFVYVEDFTQAIERLFV